ncbi:MAG: class I SAM-dependent methyltransferase [Acidimicrobiales bacterium]
MLTIANVEMAGAWDGEEGDRWTEQADRYEAAGRRQWARLVEVSGVTAGRRVLDIGCGTGKSTRDAAHLAAPGAVLGVDLSARMLDEARVRSAAEGLTNVRFERVDAQVHPFEEAAFDVVISSFGAMFFNDRATAFANLARAVRSGGTLAMLAWRELADNEWLLAFRDALAAGRTLPVPPAGGAGPFGLADSDDAAAVIAGAGFTDVAFTAVDQPIEIGADADDAFVFARTMGIVKGLTQDLDEETRASALTRLRAMLADHQTGEGVLLGAAAWLITARRA